MTTSAPTSVARRAAAVSVEKVGVAGATAKDDHATFSKVPKCATANVRLSYGAHLDGRHHPCGNVDLLKGRPS